ncbi:MAG TPA: protein translocase subunit SecD [Candidatus Saccharimonadales bacterium]|nr:protein translocase subunit SecD [Candidatus Saccharimonadales bacterium]
MRSLGNWRLVLSIAAVVISAILLLPSVQYHYGLTDAQRRDTSDPKIDGLRDRAIHLGLDLQGGIHMVLEVDASKLPKAEAAGAVDRAIEVIRNRVDQFGVAEPLIQKEGTNRIVVELPGMNDPQRARNLIGQTALLEFKVVRPEQLQLAMDRIDAYGRSHPGLVPLPKGGIRDSMAISKPLSSLAQSGDKTGAFFLAENVAQADALMAQAKRDSVLPGDVDLVWGEEESYGERTGRYLYALKKDAELNGSIVANAIARIGLEATRPTDWGVSLTLTGPGRNAFSTTTGRYVGKQLAIVLDNRVHSAPFIRERIRGDAQITGNFTDQQAKDLAIVLKAGALPAPVKIIGESFVGPTLGSDSIQKGFMAALVGAILVTLFMIVYYRFSGVIAVAAMIVNVLILMAFMPLIKQTLTLPGIAGIVLTIGVSVDANVLIFERIREEMRNKKTISASVVAGYNRAWVTILDAHVTAFLSSICLFAFGTGPIKGFAVTFSVGLVANLFTAVFMTRYVFDAMTARRRMETLSI